MLVACLWYAADPDTPAKSKMGANKVSDYTDSKLLRLINEHGCRTNLLFG
uniref:Uncharacterized protein n=1 Tax=Anguilla anguilla TaxID=7936 RepID=A0A0E9Q3J9_ANGAN